jgi:hypothetical protein
MNDERAVDASEGYRYQVRHHIEAQTPHVKSKKSVHLLERDTAHLPPPTNAPMFAVPLMLVKWNII